jgi:outer membrane protein OmpA-like peptidoglycan-associated protein
MVATLALATGSCSMMTAGRWGGPIAPPAPEQLPAAPAWVADRLARAVPDLHYPVGSSALPAGEREALGRAAPVVKELLGSFPDLVLAIEGHCDDRGPAHVNRQLGNQRADAVKNYLMSQGIPAAHLRTAGFGDAQPQCFTPDEECRRKNRRVHLRAVQRARAATPQTGSDAR